MSIEFSEKSWNNIKQYIKDQATIEALYTNIDMISYTLQKYSVENSNIILAENFFNAFHKMPIDIAEEYIMAITEYAVNGSASLPLNRAVEISTDLINIFHFTQAIKSLKHNTQAIALSPVKMSISRIETINSPLSKQLRQKEVEVIEKIKTHFEELGISFQDCFDIDTESNTNTVTIRVFQENIRRLNLPLSLYERRVLLKIANPSESNTINISLFCNKFETKIIKQKRMEEILEKIAAVLYIADISIEDGFNLFDKNGKGFVTRNDFHILISFLNLGLTQFEIDVLMNEFLQSNSDLSDRISKESFITKMSNLLDSLTFDKKAKAEEILILKFAFRINEKLEEVVSAYDCKKSGTITKNELQSALMKLNINITMKEIVILCDLCLISQNAGIDYKILISKIKQIVNEKLTVLAKANNILVRKIFTLLQLKRMSIFDGFCMFDIKLCGYLTVLDFCTGMRYLGIQESMKELKGLYKHTVGYSDKEQMSYYLFLKMFIESKAIKSLDEEATENELIKSFVLNLKDHSLSVEEFYKKIDAQNKNSVVEKQFIEMSIMILPSYTEENLHDLYYCLCKETSEDGLSFKKLTDAISLFSNATNIEKICLIFVDQIKAKCVDLRKALIIAKNIKSTKKSVDELVNKEQLLSCLESLQLNISGEEIKALVNSLIYDKNGCITAKETLLQAQKKADKYKSYKIAQQKELTQLMDILYVALCKANANIDNLFAEFDTKQEGFLTQQQFVSMLKKISINLSSKQIADLFNKIDRKRELKIKLVDFKFLVENYKLIQKDGVSPMSTPRFTEGVSVSTQHNCEEIFTKIKEKLEEKKTSIEKILKKLKVGMRYYADIKGIRKICDELSVVLSENQLLNLYQYIQKSVSKNEICYKDVLDILIRNKVELSEYQRTTIETVIVQAIIESNRKLKQYDMNADMLFNLFDYNRFGWVKRDIFLTAFEGMQLGFTKPDLNKLFDFFDSNHSNSVRRDEFNNAFNAILQSLAATAFTIDKVKVSQSSRRKLAIQLLKNIGKTFDDRGISSRQLLRLFDVNATGLLSIKDFMEVMDNLDLCYTKEQKRLIFNYFDSKDQGNVAVADIIGELHRLLDQATDGFHSLLQAKKILRMVASEAGLLYNKLLDELALYETDERRINPNIPSTIMSEAGILKSMFYQIVNKFGVLLKDEDKLILCHAFELKETPVMFNIYKIFLVFDSIIPNLKDASAKESILDATKKLGRYYIDNNLSIFDEIIAINKDNSKWIAITDYKKYLISLPLALSEKECELLCSIHSEENRINIELYSHHFWTTYSFGCSSIQVNEFEGNFLLTELQRVITHKAISLQEAFQFIDTAGNKYITMEQFVDYLSNILKIQLAIYDLMSLFRYIDRDNDSLLSVDDFVKMFDCLTDINQIADITELTKRLNTAAAAWIKKQNISTQDLLSQCKSIPFLTLDEFKVFGRNIGLNLQDVEYTKLFTLFDPSASQTIDAEKFFKHLSKCTDQNSADNAYVDHGIEIILNALNQKGASLSEYLQEYDTNFDLFLTIEQAMKALLSLTGNQHKTTIKRIIQLEAQYKADSYAISIPNLNRKIQSYLANVNNREISSEGNQIDAETFSSIISQFDGMSQLYSNIDQLTSTISQFHNYLICNEQRGLTSFAQLNAISQYQNELSMLNQIASNFILLIQNDIIDRVRRANYKILLDQPPVMMAKKDIIEKLDQFKGIIVPKLNEENLKQVKHTEIMLVDGGMLYEALYDGKPVAIISYKVNILNKSSDDGNPYLKHLLLSNQSQILCQNMFPANSIKLIGYLDKKGVDESENEHYIVYDVPDSSFLTIDKYINTHGGLIENPLMRGSNGVLYITKYIAKQMLDIIKYLHESSIILRYFSPSQIFISSNGQQLAFSNFINCGQLSEEGNISTYPNIDEALLESPYYAPEYLHSKQSNHNSKLDSWSFGVLLYNLIFGSPPPSYMSLYNEWCKQHVQASKPSHPYPKPGISFIYDPFKQLEKGSFCGVKKTPQPSHCLEYSEYFKELALKQSYDVLFEEGQILSHLNYSGQSNAIKDVLNLICICLDPNPTSRPSIEQLQCSKFWAMDKYEMMSTKKYLANIMNYVSPHLIIMEQIKPKLIIQCEKMISDEKNINEDDICNIIEETRGVIAKFCSIENKEEGKPSTINPIAEAIISENILELIQFIILRIPINNHGKETYKIVINKPSKDIVQEKKGILKSDAPILTSAEKMRTNSSKRVSFSTMIDEKRIHTLQPTQKKFKDPNTSSIKKKLLKTFTQTVTNEMSINSATLSEFTKSKSLSSYVTLLSEVFMHVNTPESSFTPYIGGLLELMVKFAVGEDNQLASQIESANTFITKEENSLKLLYKESIKKLNEVSRRKYWRQSVFSAIEQLFVSIFGESGLGSIDYPLIREYIKTFDNGGINILNCGKVFEKLICAWKLKPFTYSSAYYEQIIPLCKCILVLTSNNVGITARRTSLSNIKSAISTKQPEKIKACLDMCIGRYIIPYIYDSEEPIRYITYEILYEMSYGLIPDINMEVKSTDDRINSLSKTAVEHNKIHTLINYANRMSKLDSEIMRYLKLSLNLPLMYLRESLPFLRKIAECFESPYLLAGLLQMLRNPKESFKNKEIILRILGNIVISNERIVRLLNSPQCNFFSTLSKIIISPNTQVTHTIEDRQISEKALSLVQYIVDFRYPPLYNQMLSNISMSTKLKEFSISLPELKILANMNSYADYILQTENIDFTKISIIDQINLIKDLKCWCRYCYETSAVSKDLVKQNILKVMLAVKKLVELIWQSKESHVSEEICLINYYFDVGGWLVQNGFGKLIFNEQYSKEIILHTLSVLTSIFSESAVTSLNPNLRDYLHTGLLCTEFIYKILKMNDESIATILSEIGFGKQLSTIFMMQYKLIEKAIDQKLEKYFLINYYAEQCDLRLQIIEQLIQPIYKEVRGQFIKSKLMQNVCSDFIKSQIEFNIEYSQVDIKFLAYRKTYPLRMEGISIIGILLSNRIQAYELYVELINHLKRECVLDRELQILKSYKSLNPLLVSSSLLLCSILIDSSDIKLYTLMRDCNIISEIKSILEKELKYEEQFPTLKILLYS